MFNEDEVWAHSLKGVGVVMSHSKSILNTDITLPLYTVSVGKEMYIIVHLN